MAESLLDQLNDSFSYEPIQYHDSWLSIDPIVGCKLNCQYCYLRSVGWTGVKPQQVYSASEIVRLLHKNPYFVLHQTPLAVGNTTDIFLPENVDTACAIVQELDALGYTNTLTFVTKRQIPAYALETFSQLKHLKLIFFLSYSGLPPSVEKGVNPDDNHQNFQQLAEYRFPIVHNWRPLITFNGTAEKIETMLDFVVQYATASVVIGLKFNPTLYQLYDENEYLRLTPDEEGKYGEYIRPEIEERLWKIASEKYPDYPIYRHTSCAISYVSSRPDYTATLYDKPICLSSHCPKHQRGLCTAGHQVPTPAKVELLLEQLGKKMSFRITPTQLELDGEISQQEYTYLLHHLSYPIAGRITYTRMWRGRIYQDQSRKSAYHEKEEGL